MIEHGRIDDATHGEARASRAMTGGGYHVVVAVMLGLVHLAAAGSAAQTPAAGEWTGKAVVPKVRDFAIRDSARRPRRWATGDLPRYA